MLPLNKRLVPESIVPAYDYKKHPEPGSQITGKCLHIEKVPDLVIIDFDINKTYDEDKKEEVRNQIISRIPEHTIIVQTCSGGLHVYCNQGNFYMNKGREIKCYTCPDFEVDILGHSAIDDTKTNILMLPESKSRKNHHTPIGQYKFIHGNWESVIKENIEETLLKLKLEISFNFEDSNLDKAELNIINDTCMEDKLVDAIINGFVGIEIHRDVGGAKIDEQVTLFPLLASINCLPSHQIERCYLQIYNHCQLSISAKENFDRMIERYKNVKSTSGVGVLIKILRIYRNDYYEEHIKPFLGNKVRSLIQKINLKDDFNMEDIRRKAGTGIYDNKPNDLITDLSRVIRFIENKDLNFIQKVFDTRSKMWTITYLSNNNMSESLRKIRITITKDEREKRITALEIVNDKLYLFSIQGVVFKSDSPKLGSFFHNFKYETEEEVDFNLIGPYLQMVKEVICDNSEENFEYLKKWIAHMMQNPSKKNEVAIVLKGVQGAGKNTFSDVLCEMVAGYSEPNITDIKEICGDFNSVIEGKILIVGNELKNTGDERMANFDGLKSNITDYPLRVNEKNIPRHWGENVANFIFISNNFFPVKIEAGDRRFFVMIVNGKLRNDKKYWKKLRAGFTEDFYKALTRFFLKYDLSGFEIREFPETQARKTLISVSMNPLDQFIVENFEELKNGIFADVLKSMVYSTSPVILRTNHKNFLAQVKERCIESKATKQQHLDAGLDYDPRNPMRIYTLREDNIPIYQKLLEKQEE